MPAQLPPAGEGITGEDATVPVQVCSRVRSGAGYIRLWIDMANVGDCRSPEIGTAALAKGVTQVKGGPSEIAVLGTRDAWAVGNTFPSASRTRPIIVHWGGRRWRLTPSPATGTVQAQLWAVAGSGKSVWAVGVNGSKGQQIPLIEHRTAC